MDKFSAAVSGFFWGSVVTAASCFLLYQVMGEKKENKRDSFEVALATSSKRSMRGGLTSSDQVNFLSDLVGRLWVKIGPAIGQTIKDSVEPILKESLPGPLSSIHFTRCDFGKVPIRFDNIHVHPVEDDIVKFDLDVVWDGACDIELRAKAIKLGVKNMKLFGRMQFIMNPLSDALPCFGAIQYAFINSPVLELDFTGLANVADFGGVDKKIRVILDDIIASLMVLPTRMMYKMDVNCDYRNAFFPPLGVARITAVSGRGFKVESGGLRKDVPDVYLKIKVGASPEWKTTVQQDNLSPKWNETGEFLLSDMDQIVTIHAWDEDKGPLDPDDDLGKAKVNVSEILLSKGKTLEVQLLDEQNVGTGSFITLHCDVCSLLPNPTGFEVPPPPNQLAGLLTIMVTKGFNLPVSKKEAESFVKVKYGSQEFVTGVVYDYEGWTDGLNPIYDISFLVPITREIVEKGLPDVEFELMNGYAKPSTIGKLTVSHKTLLEAPDNVIKESRVISTAGAESTSLEIYLSLTAIDKTNLTSPMTLTAKSLESDVSGEGKDLAVAGEEKVKVTVISGQGFKVKKKKLKKNDIPDLYCTVKFGSSPQVWRTNTIKDSVTPEWKESQSYSLASESQVISLDVWDSNRKSDDDYLGSVRVAVGKVLLNSGKLELELQNEGNPLGYFVTIACEVE